MTTFDRIVIALGAAATAVGSAGTAGDMPKWATITCLALVAACGALAPSLRPSKRPPDSTQS